MMNNNPINNPVYNVFNMNYVQEQIRILQEQQRNYEQMQKTFDCAKKLDDFLKSLDEVEPRNRGIAAEECSAVLYKYLHNHGVL